MKSYENFLRESELTDTMKACLNCIKAINRLNPDMQYRQSMYNGEVELTLDNGPETVEIDVYSTANELKGVNVKVTLNTERDWDKVRKLAVNLCLDDIQDMEIVQAWKGGYKSPEKFSKWGQDFVSFGISMLINPDDIKTKNQIQKSIKRHEDNVKKKGS